jgi:hypothetical protein
LHPAAIDNEIIAIIALDRNVARRVIAGRVVDAVSVMFWVRLIT